MRKKWIFQSGKGNIFDKILEKKSVTQTHLKLKDKNEEKYK